MTRPAKAVRNLNQAARYRRSGTASGALQADALTAEAEELLKPPQPVMVIAGEVVPSEGPVSDDGAVPVSLFVKNTLAGGPNAIAATASEERTARAAELDALEVAIDAAQSIEARNSIERMIAHECGIAHDAGLRLLRRGLEQKASIESARLVAAATRLLEIVREGALAIHRLRRGGQQTVLVQHVTVSGSAQAVVAGNLEQGPRAESDKGVQKNRG